MLVRIIVAAIMGVLVAAVGAGIGYFLLQGHALVPAIIGFLIGFLFSATARNSE